MAGRAARQVLHTVGNAVAPGVTTKHLDDIAFEAIRSLGMKPAFLGYRGYPATICASVNDELVHGIPRHDRVLRDGDIISVDLGTIGDGFYGDTAATFTVGEVSSEAQKLITTANECLDRAIAAARPGNRMGDVAWAVQGHAEQQAYGVVRDYVGHGIGRAMHEDPPVPNFGEPSTGLRLVPGMVFAIEPMITQGSWRVATREDGWTVVTVDGALCAHCEHVVAVTEDGSEVLTAYSSPK